jgi:hypothetical protein
MAVHFESLAESASVSLLLYAEDRARTLSV